MILEKLVITAFAAFMGYRYGVPVGYYFNAHDYGAALFYGGTGAFIVAWLAGQFILDHMKLETLISLAFAAAVTYWCAVPVGYGFFGMHDHVGAAMYGSIVALPAFIVGGLVVWPIVRKLSNLLLGTVAREQRGRKQRAAKPAAQSLAEIDAEIASGYKAIYRGLIDRDYTFMDGRTKRERICAKFEVSRHTLSMPVREREALRIYRVLEQHGLPPAVADRILYALAWGDGQCQTVMEPVTMDTRMAQQNGLKTARDILAAEAASRQISVGGGISETFAALQEAASKPNAHPDVVALYQSYMSSAARQIGQSETFD